MAIAQYKKNMIGKRIRLQYTNDPYTNLKPGDEGVVSLIDDFGTICVNWDSGSTLGLNPEFGDRYVLIEEN